MISLILTLSVIKNDCSLERLPYENMNKCLLSWKQDTDPNTLF